MNRYLRIAKELSINSDHAQHKIGAVIVNKNRIVSKGWNQLKTHSKSPHPYKSIHSEFDAVNKANPEQLKGATIYIYREHKNGECAISRPCPSCFSMLKSKGIEKIVYTSEKEVKEEII